MTDVALKSTDGTVYAPGTSDAEIETAARRAALQRKRIVVFWRLAILVALLGLWEGCARTGIIDSFFYSYPTAIAQRTWDLIVEGTDEAPLWYHLWITMEESLIGFVSGSVIGVLFGVLLGRNRMAADIFSV